MEIVAAIVVEAPVSIRYVLVSDLAGERAPSFSPD
jgi:hypothetical protein